MARIEKERSELDIARRQECQAHNELEYRERQAQEQQSQLDSLLKHRQECFDGLNTAIRTGLTPVHVREYQLLMTHIDSVVEVIEHKVEASQENYEKAKEIWKKKNENYVKVKEMMEQALIPDSETVSAEIEDSKEAADTKEEGSNDNKEYYGDKIIPVVSQ